MDRLTKFGNNAVNIGEKVGSGSITAMQKMNRGLDKVGFGRINPVDMISNKPGQIPQQMQPAQPAEKPKHRKVVTTEYW